MRAQWADPAHRERHSARMRAQWRDPEYRRLRTVSEQSTFDDVLARLVVDPLSSCWVWVGSLDRSGYAKTQFHGRTVSVHRLVYETLVGETYGADVHHTCHNRRCANPAHLTALSHEEHCRISAASRREIRTSRPDWVCCDAPVEWFRVCPNCGADAPTEVA
jgi:hypothetical protein